MSADLPDRIIRQHAIARVEPMVLQPRSGTGPVMVAGGGGIFRAKVIEFNAFKREVWVKFLKDGIDPADDELWADDNSFLPDLGCAYTMENHFFGVGWAALIFTFGADKSWALPGTKIHFDIVDPAIHQMGEPDGATAPDLSFDSLPPVPRPGICSETWACCLPDGTCEELNEIDCAAAGGIYHADLPCDDPLIDCQPQSACQRRGTLTPSGCVDFETQAECAAIGGTHYPCTCADLWSVSVPTNIHCP